MILSRFLSSGLDLMRTGRKNLITLILPTRKEKEKFSLRFAIALLHLFLKTHARVKVNQYAQKTTSNKHFTRFLTNVCHLTLSKTACLTMLVQNMSNVKKERKRFLNECHKDILLCFLTSPSLG